MKPFPARWMIAAPLAVLLMVPAAGSARLQETPPAAQEPATPPQPELDREPTGTTGRPAESSGEQKPDAETALVRQHLTAARNALSEVTQLPAAAQLTGETRNQVSQLIANFNELITTTTDWRGAHAKVEANLLPLIGPEEGEPAQAPAAAGGDAASGMADLDPEIRGKLVEFRNHLNDFERAAGGASDVATRASATDPTAASGATSTGTEQATPGTLPGAAPGGTEPSIPADLAAGADGTDDAMRHLEAIEAILEVRPSAGQEPVGTVGTPDPSKPAAPASEPPQGGLDAAKVELLRGHLRELRRILEDRR